MDSDLYFHIRKEDGDNEYFVGMVDDYYHHDAVVPGEDHIQELYVIDKAGQPPMRVHVYWIGEMPEPEVRETVVNSIVEEVTAMFDGSPGNYRWN